MSNNLLRILENKEMSIEELEKLSGISIKTIKKIAFSKDYNYKILAVKKICDILEISFKDFFDIWKILIKKYISYKHRNK